MPVDGELRGLDAFLVRSRLDQRMGEV